MFTKYPSINQFRHVVHDISERTRFIGKDKDGNAIFDPNKPLPTVAFIQTVKVHGTNGGVSLTKDGTLEVQSRNRLLSYDDDNNGFYKWVMARQAWFKQMLLPFFKDDIEQVTVFGEFAGESIQKGVAVSQLPKAFYVFEVMITLGDESYYGSVNDVLHFNEPSLHIYPIYQFTTKRLDIDFNRPDDVIDELTKAALDVERCCPVGAYFGVSGTGEGVVLTGMYRGNMYRFKVKGEKHAVSKVKILSDADKVQFQHIHDFVEQVVTDNRLRQGIEYLNEMGQIPNNKAIGTFLKWVVDDVKKEEHDLIQAKGFDER